MKQTHRLLLTGGGTAGHVIPQLALIQYLQSINASIQYHYIGSYDGIEKKLISTSQIPYYGISTGKWRRYRSLLNLVMPFQVLRGIGQAIRICYRLKPSLVFSKGGFVAVPVVVAAWLLRIPIIIHESDLIPGLANRLSFPLAKKILYSFTVPLKVSYASKSKVTGLPIRMSLAKGVAQKGLDILKFSDQKPILLIWGGSLGAVSLNISVTRLLPDLLKQFQVIHICGVGKLPKEDRLHPEYRVFEYLEDDKLPHILKAADVVVSRAGATAIYELLLLHKPHILCPLSRKSSRGEQIENARYFEKKGLSAVLYPEYYTEERLLKRIQAVYRNRVQWQSAMSAFNLQSGTSAIHAELSESLEPVANL